jgi:hypothetical protein
MVGHANVSGADSRPFDSTAGGRLAAFTQRRRDRAPEEAVPRQGRRRAAGIQTS